MGALYRQRKPAAAEIQNDETLIFVNQFNSLFQGILGHLVAPADK
jgi:hypothetical protein